MKSSEIIIKRLEKLTQGKKVAILGFGREGQSTYRLLHKSFPDLHLLIMDQLGTLPEQAQALIAGDSNTEVLLGAKYIDRLTECETIFKTPGVSPFLLEIQDAISRGAVVTSQTDLFFAAFGAQIIAVTGTKGKSTTCKVITHVLSDMGREVLFIGNIGSPAFDHLDEVGEQTLVVYETSSHQCEGLNTSPHVGVFLNLFTDHMDYYPSMEAYGLAKRELFVHQTSEDLCIYNIADPRVLELTQNLPGRRLGFSLEKQPAAVFLEDGWIQAGSEKIIPASEIPLLGKHNLQNVMPAILIALEMGMIPSHLRASLKTVEPVEKRLETVGTVKGVTFVDDALATIPEAAIAALEALGDRVSTLIVGGFDRGQDFTALAEKIAASQVKTLILFPTTGAKIAELVKGMTDKVSAYPVKSMAEAVKTALEHTPSGKTVLLSTASASFGMFKDYRDRSEQLFLALKEMGA